ncbi:MAG: VIT domain-containing protein [Fuerstiella sp.]
MYQKLFSSLSLAMLMTGTLFVIGCGEGPKDAAISEDASQLVDSVAEDVGESTAESDDASAPETSEMSTELFSDNRVDMDLSAGMARSMVKPSVEAPAQDKLVADDDQKRMSENTPEEPSGANGYRIEQAKEKKVSSGDQPMGRGRLSAAAGGIGGEGGNDVGGFGGGLGGGFGGGGSLVLRADMGLNGPADEVDVLQSQPPVTGSGRGRNLGSKLRAAEQKIAIERQAQSGMPRTVSLQPGEELWVIAQPSDAASTASDDRPGSGCLMARLPNGTKQVPVPLKHTAVVGNIDGYIASVNVTQQFQNPYDSKIEASYVFPLPQNAAVNEFVMTVGDRKIRGIIREKEKAKQIYEAAKRQGHVASLMTQQRPNVFTQKVANIEPGKQIDIEIRYFNTLRYDDGAYEFVFPMVVGPRFNPSSGDGIGAVARTDQGTSGQSTEVQYLAPNERSGHDVSVTVNINAGIQIEDVNCINHAIETKQSSSCYRTVTLSERDRIPNKDFVLRYQVASDRIKTAMLTHDDENGQYFTMMVYPPKSLASVQRSPMEMVFVLDCSGSMRGAPMKQAKAAIRHALQSLTDRDTFQIIRFSNNASQLGSEPLLATTANVQRGLSYLGSLSGTGGTRMIEGIKAALDFPHDEGRFRLVSFMTDGYIGNEQQILTTLHEKLGSSRIFSFGVGSSPNRFLMNRMASLGKGAVAYLSLNDDAVKIVNKFNDQISHPAMTDLTIDWGNMNVTDVYPSRLPDLIVGRPVVLTGRFNGQPGTVKINGRVDMEPASFDVAIDEDEDSKKHEGIAAVWARLKIKDLMLQKAQVPAASDEIENAVKETALAYNLMSSFTSFVAVDSMTKTKGQFGTTVAVPVSVPDGVRYDTTVGGEGSEDVER